MDDSWVRRPESSLTTVFLHGILSDGDSCWRHANGTYWPDLLRKEKSLRSTGIYVFEYKTGLFSGTYRLGDVVDALRNQLKLDDVQESEKLVFVGHSMGGIVARRFLVQQQSDLIEANKKIGLFMLASPSVGSRYAQWLFPIARLFNHTQEDALRFAQDNAWLMDLDRDFLALKEKGRLCLRGKELVEDNFIVMHRMLRRQIVEPFSGARYFDDALKIANSDHFSIAKIPDATAIQHRLLVEFIHQFQPENAVTNDVTRALSEHSSDVSTLPQARRRATPEIALHPEWVPAKVNRIHGMPRTSMMTIWWGNTDSRSGIESKLDKSTWLSVIDDRALKAETIPQIAQDIVDIRHYIPKPSGDDWLARENFVPIKFGIEFAKLTAIVVITNESGREVTLRVEAVEEALVSDQRWITLVSARLPNGDPAQEQVQAALRASIVAEGGGSKSFVLKDGDAREITLVIELRISIGNKFDEQMEIGPYAMMEQDIALGRLVASDALLEYLGGNMILPLDFYVLGYPSHLSLQLASQLSSVDVEVDLELKQHIRKINVLELAMKWRRVQSAVDKIAGGLSR